MAKIAEMYQWMNVLKGSSDFKDTQTKAYKTLE